MKLIRLATVAALSTTILAGGAAAAFAEETHNVTTTGQATFRAFNPDEDEDGDEIIVSPPETIEPPVIIDPIGPGLTGPLTIAYAPTMNFGSQVISNQDQTYNMVAEMQTVADEDGNSTTNQIPYTSFAQVQDIRGTNEGWNLQVSLTDFTSGTQNNVLTGAEIEFVGSRIQYEGNNAENAPMAHADGLTLIPGAGAVSVMTAAEGQGAGASSVVWGDQADLTAQFEDEEIEVVENSAIQLSIPGSTAKDATTYTSTLSWELTSTPGADA